MTQYGVPDTCKNGHAFTPANTRWEKHADGCVYRRCITCRKNSNSKRRRKQGRKSAEEVRAERRRRDKRIRELHAQGLKQVQIARRVGCSTEVVRAAVQPEYAKSRRKWARESMARRRAEHRPKKISAAAWRALKTRHAAAMRIVDSLSPNDRWELLAAVVWPEDERLEGIA